MMKRLVFTTFATLFPIAAGAADLAPVPPSFTWSGLYLGGQIGYGWGEDSSNIWLSGLPGRRRFSGVFSGSTQLQGVIGGGHIGYNWQLGQFVVGLEGRIDGTSVSKSTQPVGGLLYNVKTESPLQGTFLGRIGYAFDRTLVYATGGGGYAWLQNNYALLGGMWTNSTTRSFWTVGGGIEYAVTDNWSVRAEYRYSNLGSFTDGPIVYPAVFQSHSWKQDVVQVGFSYRFPPVPPAAVVTKY